MNFSGLSKTWFVSLAGFLSRRPKDRKYKTKIVNLADAIEPSPFFLRSAASYLRAWVTETAQLTPALDVSILTTSSTRLVVSEGGSHHSLEVATLEPSVSNIRIERAGAQVPQEVIVDPRTRGCC